MGCGDRLFHGAETAAVVRAGAVQQQRPPVPCRGVTGVVREAVGRPARAEPRHGARSEEHTSELQSRQYLVCRLLLEKKKKSLSDLLTISSHISSISFSTSSPPLSATLSSTTSPFPSFHLCRSLFCSPFTTHTHHPFS